jgi:hypothetical protein
MILAGMRRVEKSEKKPQVGMQPYGLVQNYELWERNIT